MHRPLILYINSSQNFVADYLANFARTEKRTVVWLGSGPPGALGLSRVDCNPRFDWVIQAFTRKKKVIWYN